VKINLFCIYRLQEIPVSQFLYDLDDLLSTQSCNYDTVILTGDFNFHFENSDSKNVEALIDLTSSYGLFQFVVGPSHRLGHTLDLVFANRHEFNLPLLQPLDLHISDHFPILFNLPSFDHATQTQS
jgi:endonuclease/exonuclease/phosphatase (EEP) superfamily protein YafD